MTPPDPPLLGGVPKMSILSKNRQKVMIFPLNFLIKSTPPPQNPFLEWFWGGSGGSKWSLLVVKSTILTQNRVIFNDFGGFGPGGVQNGGSGDLQNGCPKRGVRGGPIFMVSTYNIYSDVYLASAFFLYGESRAGEGGINYIT